MGQPEWICTLHSHEIEEIRSLTQEESGIGGSMPRDSVDCNIYFRAAVMP